MTDLEIYQKARIQALENLAIVHESMIDELGKQIDKITFKYADSKARLNMLIRNIEVIDEIFEQPIKN